ncbi:serine hydrolase domain-containing protein [Brevibacterium litoralis]|uniref:serine hydrolase domain-containing protein n=1 Tax=Brevibacterium litoralis TaxID=3138935 RepID=UPI0032EE8CF2
MSAPEAPSPPDRPSLDEAQRSFHEELSALVEGAVGSGTVTAVAAGVVFHEEPGPAGPDDPTATRHVTTARHVATAGCSRDALFRISSMTKPLTTACALVLAERAALPFDTPLGDLLPELADMPVLDAPDGPLDRTHPPRRAPTFEDLLTYTWGFGMDMPMFAAAGAGDPWPVFAAAEDLHTFGPPVPRTGLDRDTWLTRLSGLPLLTEPGERWWYSSGSHVLGAWIERHTGLDLETALRRYLLDPWGLPDTTFTATTEGERNRLGPVYETTADGLAVVDGPGLVDGLGASAAGVAGSSVWTREPAFHDAAAGLLSTVDDCLEAGRRLLAGDTPGLPTDLRDRMLSDRLTPDQRRATDPQGLLGEGLGWGYGLAVHPDGSYGWDGGFGSIWRNLPGPGTAADAAGASGAVAGSRTGATIVVLTDRIVDAEGWPPVCAQVLDLARAHLDDPAVGPGSAPA